MGLGRNWLPSKYDARVNFCDLMVVESTPVDGYACGFKFRLVPKILIVKPALGMRQSLTGVIIEGHHVNAAVRMKALQSMQAPNLGMGMHPKQRHNVSCITAADEHQAGPS